MEQVITVGLGELVVSDDPAAVLVAFGLGSCVGVAAYDSVRRVGALLHAMLPQQRNGDANRTKYVDTGVIDMLNRLGAIGAQREQLVWRYVGGAEMLMTPGLTDRFSIGLQNTAMTQNIVNRERLRVVAVDTGGHEGRTLRLFVSTGRVTVRKVNGEDRQL